MGKLTIETFTDSINEDLTWRKKEISDLLFLRNENNNFLILKSAILLMYSHWEGYVKNISKQYLILVSDLNIQISQLNMNFEAIDMKGNIKDCWNSRESLNLVNEIKLVERMYDEKSSVFKLPASVKKEKDKSIINTRDNLNIETFQSFLKVVGLYEFKPLETRIVYIDEKLLQNRNIIAHGSKLHPKAKSFDMDIEEIKKLRDFISLIMEHLRDELIYFAEKELYLYSNLKKIEERKEFRNQQLEKAIKQIYPEDEE